ncbi:MAG: hypothetical protein AB7I48_26490 [Planctomycetaceae bacterium]
MDRTQGQRTLNPVFRSTWSEILAKNGALASASRNEIAPGNRASRDLKQDDVKLCLFSKPELTAI